MSRIHFPLGEFLGGFWWPPFGKLDRTPRVAVPAADESERLAAIHASAFARPWSAAEFEGFLADPAVRLDALYLGRSRVPAGFSVSRTVLDEAEILSVALAREARRGGHSSHLLAYHLQNLAHAGIRRVHLEVETGNTPALSLYRRLRFVESGRRAGYYARPDGTRVDAISMSLAM